MFILIDFVILNNQVAEICRSQLLIFQSMFDFKNSAYRITLPMLNGFEVKDSREIVCCIADGNYTLFYFDDKRHPLLITMPLADTEKKLSRWAFIMRIHKSHLVNLDYVKQYLKGKDGTVLLRNEMSLTVSRTYLDEFLKKINGSE